MTHRFKKYYYFPDMKKYIKVSIFYKESFNNFWTILLKSLPFIFMYTFIYIIYYLIIYNFSIVHARIINILSKIIGIFFNIKYMTSWDIFIELSFSFLYLISFNIYLEIIEIKCFKLNFNTRRNILIRENLDEILNKIGEYEEEDINKNNILEKKVELSQGYLVDFNDIPKKNNNSLDD